MSIIRSGPKISPSPFPYSSVLSIERICKMLHLSSAYSSHKVFTAFKYSSRWLSPYIACWNQFSQPSSLLHCPFDLKSSGPCFGIHDAVDEDFDVSRKILHVML